MSFIAQLILVGSLLAGMGAGVFGLIQHGRNQGRAECQAQQAEQRALVAEAVDAALNTAATAIAGIKVQNRTITNEVQHEITTRTVYADCSHTPKQLQRINAALTGKPAAQPAGGGLVPRAGAPGRPQLRRDDAQADRAGGAVPGVPSSGAGGAVTP